MPSLSPDHGFELMLLGGFEARFRGRPVAGFSYDKMRALLAYLAVERVQDHSREALAGLLWGGDPTAARGNLRRTLSNLRRVLEPSAGSLMFSTGKHTIRFIPNCYVDVLDFTGQAPAPDAAQHDEERVVALYRGEFLAGLSLPDCSGFEDWLQLQREALRRRALSSLERLANRYEQTGDYDKALQFALRHIELEPWDEGALRRAMRLYAVNGQVGAAIALYETCCRLLKKELGVLPGEETRQLAERIRNEALSRHELKRRTVSETIPQRYAERRQVTVLYCELTLAGNDDPDEVAERLCDPQSRCVEIIRRFSGHVVQTHGGGLLAYFGYPQAHEDAARHAVQAALAVTREAAHGIEIRAGAHTGLILTGGGSSMPDTVGKTSRLAIQLRQNAAPNEVAISQETHCIVGGYFDCVSLGVQPLPDARPLEIFKVLRESGARTRLDAAARLTPLVGREAEIAGLRGLWEKAAQGARQVVLVRGEAGIGKSRLLLSLKDALREQAYVLRELHCFPEHSQSPFYSLVALYEFALGFSPGDTPEIKFDKLAEYVGAYYPRTERDAVPLLARMLSLPLRAPYREPVSAPQQQREKTLALVLDRLYALAAQQPVLLVGEDLHWADPSTLEFLNRFVMQERAAPLLAVFTARPEFQPPWREGSLHTLTLDALDDGATAALIAAVAPQIEPETLRRIVERADGVPLFAEEMAKIATQENQASIPATLHDLLAARLDRMGGAKRTAQLAATLGREFDPDLLRRVSTCAPATLAQNLSDLQDAGLILEVNETARQFKHALIREAAYQSQSRAERQAAHRHVAQILQSDFPDVVASRPEFLAQHLFSGGETRQSIACWISAGQRAARHSAGQEAVSHFKSGLALIEALPDDAERLRLELDLQFGLGAAACEAQGYASDEGAAAYARAMTLCKLHESGADLFPAVWGLWASASSRAGYADARELAQQLLRMAGQSGDPVHLQQGHFALADTLFWQGEFTAAREHLERVGALYRTAHHASHVAGFGEDAGVTGGAYASWVLWFLGFPDQARQAGAQTLSLARRLGHPFSLAYALTFAALLHCRLRQPEQALVLAQETLGLAEHYGFSLWQIGATLARGWALAMQNRQESVEIMQKCVEATRAAMGGVTLVVLEPLINACLALGRFDAALEANDEAMVVGNAFGDRHVDAELHRLRGEALLGSSDANAAQAEACFREALAISRKQQAKSLELRAATSMARLWQRQGKQEDARRLLEEAYNWFTEGFDTLDLQEAADLLRTLG